MPLRLVSAAVLALVVLAGCGSSTKPVTTPAEAVGRLKRLGFDAPEPPPAGSVTATFGAFSLDPRAGELVETLRRGGLMVMVVRGTATTVPAFPGAFMARSGKVIVEGFPVTVNGHQWNRNPRPVFNEVAQDLGAR